MKKILVALMTIVAFATITTITSCTAEVDKCKNVTCQNGGTCTDGTCACAAGYEGTNCETLMVTKFIGDWKGDDNCTTGTYSNITFTNTTQSSNVLNISIKNIGGFGATEIITGTISSTSSNQIVYTNQTLSGSRTISGTMTLSGTSLTNSYTVTPAVGVADVCSGTYIKL